MSLSIVPIDRTRSTSFVGSVAGMSPAEFQAALQNISTTASSEADDGDLREGCWAPLTELVYQGQSSSMLRPLLSGFSMASQVHGQRAISLDETIAELMRRTTLGPVRRNDPIAQNSHHWTERTAIRSGRKRTTYRTLDSRADIIGSYLAGCIRDSGQSVGMFFGRKRSATFEIALGARRAGVSFTNFHSYLSGKDFLDYVLEGPYRVLFLDTESFTKVEPYLPLLLDQNKVIIDIDNQHPQAISYKELLSEIERPFATTPDVKAHEYPGPTMYSSGTTGKPHLVSVRSVPRVGAQANRLFGITEHDVNLVVGQLYHGGAYSWAKGHMNRGAQVVLTQSAGLTLDPAEVVKAIQEKKITNFWISPPWLQSLCHYINGLEKRPELSSLRAIFVGAAPFHPALKRLAMGVFGPIVWENYAITEFGLVSILPPSELLAHATTVGRLAPGVEIDIRDGLAESVPPGQTGKIYIKNAQTGGEFLPSDDMGILDTNGYLSVLGRTTETAVIGGVQVFPRLIENEIMEIPGVYDCYVISMKEADYEEIVIAVVPEWNSHVDQTQILNAYRASPALAHLQGLPVRVTFVSALPRAPYKVNVALVKEMVLRRQRTG